MLLLKLTTENLADGLIFTIFGFCIVMLVLLLITFVLYIFSWIVNGAEKKKASANRVEEIKEEVVAPTVVAEPVPQVTDDTELVAVITAAIAASLNTTSDKLVVRSIRKVNSWKKESIREKNKGLI